MGNQHAAGPRLSDDKKSTHMLICIHTHTCIHACMYTLMHVHHVHAHVYIMYIYVHVCVIVLCRVEHSTTEVWSMR